MEHTLPLVARQVIMLTIFFKKLLHVLLWLHTHICDNSTIVAMVMYCLYKMNLALGKENVYTNINIFFIYSH